MQDLHVAGPDGVAGLAWDAGLTAKGEPGITPRLFSAPTEFDKTQRRGYNKKATPEGEAERALLHKRRLATPLRKGVMPMGDGRWAKALRVLVWFVIVLLVMILTAQKAY